MTDELYQTVVVVDSRLQLCIFYFAKTGFREPKQQLRDIPSTLYASRVRRKMLAALLCACSFGCRSPRQPETVLQISTDDAVTVTDVHFHSPSTNGLFWYRIIVPKDGHKDRFPVLYLFHGANGGPVEMMGRSNVVKLSSDSHLITGISEISLF